MADNELYIIEDTRNKINCHDEKNKYFQEKNIKVLRSKLPYGDYARIDKMNISVDTKMSALELFNCLTKDHVRFRKEIIGANDFDIGIVILIEEEDYYATLDVFKDWYRVPRWKSDGWKTKNGKKIRIHKKGEPMSEINVDAMVKAMKTMQEKYAVLFKFTTKDRCGADIINILYTRYNDYNIYFNNKIKSIKELKETDAKSKL